ncbi:fused MFS/spermidine synthase [Thermomonas carbonis]|uniref:Fused MFS/spermidine synthase n=1 Tax=Thermomonas carbonis TaxID=1463158 RepID=A0A7G9SLI6_9GAMM|nr:fused MFS/spermidine synthase [Thermomonas carbonis]QNN68711.1 fused MFS/spermidine synthase [Thermomonas carbonis]GHC09336.1 spermidine synthase [Thermomonas carbonis]
MSEHKARLGHALLWIFALSGFAGLIYQSIWTQYLGLFLGHSAYAQSLVLMLFMGGMALGAWLVSRRTESLRRPLLAYAVIELVIGVLGLLFDPLYHAGTAWAYESLMQSATGNGLRWTMATVLVLPQCVLLGATFPLMSAGYMRLQPASEGRVLAGLYFANSIGAAIGALAATYLLLPKVGLPGAIMTAGLLNIAVAVAIYPISKHEGAVAATPKPAAAPRTRMRTATPLLVLTVAALTGATSFVYEITWVRMLSLALGTTIHAFEVMLAAFISGIAFGGLWLRHRADRLQSPLATAGWVQVLMGLAALASMFVYAHAFEWVGWLLRVIARTGEGYALYNLSSGLISLLVMFPAAFFAGMTLPLLTLELLRQGGGERVIGRVYATNTLGAIVGVLVAVHLLLPMLGLKLALWLAAAVDLVLGVVVLHVMAPGRSGRRPGPAVFAALVSVFALALSLWLVKFDPLMLASSVYRHGSTFLDNTRMRYYRDGKTASVALYERGEGKGLVRAISTNGKVDAALSMHPEGEIIADEYTMVMAAALPLSMRDRFDRVGVIGFGSGLTTHALLGSERIGQVDTIEIEPMMVEGAKLFGDRVSRAYEDPRSHIVIDDAKAFFASSPRRYDLIVSEPSNPWMGGTATLFSEEFYSFVPRHLEDDGIFLQWVQTYEINPALVSSVLRAMLGHFSDVQAYLSNGEDLLLIAVPKGKVPALGARLFGDAGLRDDLARLGFRDVRDLQDTFVMDRRALVAYANLHPSQANSDFFPILQLQAPATRFMKAKADLNPWHGAPWPVVPFLGGFSPRSIDQPPPGVRRPVVSDSKQKAARELRRLLVEGDARPAVDAHDPQLDYAEALRGLGMSCRLDGAPGRNAELIFALASDTVAFLDVPAQVGLWQSPAWLECPPTSPLLLQALAFVDAASRNDHARVLDVGRTMLDGPDAALVAGSAVSSKYVFGAMLFAAMASGRNADVPLLYNKYWNKLHPSLRDSETIRLLLVLAASPQANPEAPLEATNDAEIADGDRLR